MSMKKCKECGKDVSSKAKVCPNCGKKLKMGFFKKMLIVFGVIIIIIIIASTGNKETSPSASSTNQLKTEQKSKESITAKIGDEITVGHFVYRVNNIQYKKTIGNEFASETADGVFLIINISIKNQSKETRTLDGSMFKLVDSDDIVFEHSNKGSTALMMVDMETLFLKECQPKIQTSGYLVFEVPNRTDKYLLQLSGGFWSGATASVVLQ